MFLCLGYYCAGNGSLPIICPIGSYCPIGSSLPQLCGIGSTTLLVGRSSLLSCYCINGYYGLNGRDTCNICHAGYYCISNNGTNGSLYNNQTMCNINTYCPIGSSLPLSCGQGSQSLIASVSSLNCSCSPSWFGNNGANSCSPCTAGYYCPGTRSNHSHSYNNNNNMQSCDHVMLCCLCRWFIIN